MKSIKQQYIDLKEGKMSQAQFMRNIRMTMPQYVTNITSFDDSVRILKNKGILNESDANQSEPPYGADASKLSDKELKQKYEMYKKASSDPRFNDHGKKLLTKYEAEYKKRFNESTTQNETVYDDRGEELERLDQIAQQASDYISAVAALEDYGVDPKMAVHIASNFHSENDSSSIGSTDPMVGENKDISVSYEDNFKATIDGKNYEVEYHNNEVGDEITLKNGEEIKTGIVKSVSPEGDLVITLNEAKITADKAHPQELRMGIRVEMEHTDDPKKAEKIALDHLSENPFYYTMLKLSGADAPISEKPKAKIEKKKDETCLVDKANGMKPVKGFENAKASANKAKKETVKGEHITLMSLVAKSVRGVQKMDPTGEKMKKVKLSESEGIEEELPQDRAFFRSVPADPKYNVQKDSKGRIMQATNNEGETFSVNDVAIAVDNGQEVKILSFEEEQGKVKARYDSHARAIDIDGLQQKPKDNKVNLSNSFDKIKDKLKEIIRKELKEFYDGRDNLTDVTGETEEK